VAGAVAPEVEVVVEGVVVAGLEELGDDPGLEQGAAQGVGGELVCALDAQKAGSEAGIVEVELRGLDQALVEAPVVRTEPIDDVARLEHRDPLARRVVADAAVVSQGAQVEELAGSAGAHADEALEEGQVPDVDHLAHIAFHVGPHVVAVPDGGVQPPVVNRWVEALEEEGFHGLRSSVGALKLAEGERQERDEGGASGEGLGDPGQQAELLRPGQDELARSPGCVDSGLEVGEQVRRSLGLVEDRTLGEPAQEPARIVRSAVRGMSTDRR
jgi:hypothetical protein